MTDTTDNITGRPTWMLPTPPRRDDISTHPSDIGDVSLRGMTLRLMRGHNLAQPEAAQFVNALVHPATPDAQIAAALVALAIKGETTEELAGMAEAMCARAVPINSRHTNFIDTAGTGSSRVKTFNVSTAAAFVIAGANLPVAKHGSRAATSKSGSADVLDALGINTSAPPETSELCLNEIGICFMFAPIYHGSTRRVTQVRRELGVHTTFNLLGPLTNPAKAPRQIIGVWHPSLLPTVARALRALGTRHAWVVHGTDGLDEITLAGVTQVAAVQTETDANDIEMFTVEPRDFGLGTRKLDDLRGGDAIHNARIIKEVLDGKQNTETSRAARDLVIINAAAALYIGGIAGTLKEASQCAATSIDTGAARGKLDALIRETNQ